MNDDFISNDTSVHDVVDAEENVLGLILLFLLLLYFFLFLLFLFFFRLDFLLLQFDSLGASGWLPYARMHTDSFLPWLCLPRYVPPM